MAGQEVTGCKMKRNAFKHLRKKGNFILADDGRIRERFSVGTEKGLRYGVVNVLVLI